MIINGPDGKAVIVTPDGRIPTLAANEPFMHAMAESGLAWSIPFTQTGAANTTDNAVFHFKNTSDETFDIHGMFCSSAEAGLWSLYTGRTYSSGGTAVSLAQLNTGSGKTQDMTAYYGTGITLAGTATLIAVKRQKADTPFDILSIQQALQISPSNTFEVRFKADTGNTVMACTLYTHGAEPWE